MNGLDYFFRLRRSQEDNTLDNETWRKKAEDSEAALALIQIQKEKELSLLRESITALETRLSEESSVAQTKINDLEAKLTDANAKSEKAIRDHLNIQKELSSVRIQAELCFVGPRFKLPCGIYRRY
jgi:hypothetical protein